MWKKHQASFPGSDMKARQQKWTWRGWKWWDITRIVLKIETRTPPTPSLWTWTPPPPTSWLRPTLYWTINCVFGASALHRIASSMFEFRGGGIFFRPFFSRPSHYYFFLVHFFVLMIFPLVSFLFFLYFFSIFSLFSLFFFYFSLFFCFFIFLHFIVSLFDSSVRSQKNTQMASSYGQRWPNESCKFYPRAKTRPGIKKKLFRGILTTFSRTTFSSTTFIMTTFFLLMTTFFFFSFLFLLKKFQLCRHMISDCERGKGGYPTNIWVDLERKKGKNTSSVLWKLHVSQMWFCL